MNAPAVTRREQVKPSFSAAVHSYTDALRVLRDASPEGRTTAQLAEETGRVPSNMRRDIHKLEAAEVIELMATSAGGPVLWTITDKGRQWVAGQDLAEGLIREAPTAEDRSLVPGAVFRAHPDRLIPDPDQPRKTFDEDDLAALSDSILDLGVLQTILVRPAGPDGKHMIVAGERRWRACMKLVDDMLWDDGATVPVAIATVEDEAEVLEQAVVENLQRAELNHIEIGASFERLAVTGGRTNPQIARSVGKTPEYVQQHRRLTKLSEVDQARVAAGELTMHEALALLRPEKTEPERYVARFDRHKPDHTVEDVWFASAGRMPTERSPVEEWIEPGTFTTFSMAGRMQQYGPGARIQIAALKGQSGWVFETAWIAGGLGSSGALTFIYPARAAFLDRETAIQAGVDCLREGIGRNLNYKYPATHDAWLTAMADPLTRPAPDGPFVVNGTDYLNATRAQEARFALGIDKRPEANSGGPSLKKALEDLTAGDEAAARHGAETGVAMATPPTRPLSPMARLALIELGAKIQTERRPYAVDNTLSWSGDDMDYAMFGASVGQYWLDAAHGELIAAPALVSFSQVRGGLPPIAQITFAGLELLKQILKADTAYVSASTLTMMQAQSPAGSQGHGQYATPWLQTVAQPAPAATPAADDAEPRRDRWGRDAAAIEADALLLTRVQNRGRGDPTETRDGLFHALDIASARFDPGDCDLDNISLLNSSGEIVTNLSVDTACRLNPERTRALTELIAQVLFI